MQTIYCSGVFSLFFLRCCVLEIPPANCSGVACVCLDLPIIGSFARRHYRPACSGHVIFSFLSVGAELVRRRGSNVLHDHDGGGGGGVRRRIAELGVGRDKQGSGVVLTRVRNGAWGTLAGELHR